VNFPPSTDDPSGFSIRYVWRAFLDGPANHPGFQSEEYTTIYRPLISAPSPTPWTFQETLYKEPKKSALAIATASLSAQVFCPEDTINIDLKINSIPSDVIITSIHYKFRKNYKGKLLLQHGSATKFYFLDIIQKRVPMISANNIQTSIQIELPARLVSPCFTSKNLCVYYSLLFTVQMEYGSLLKSTQYTQLEIPIGMANLANSQLAQVQDLTLIRDYRESEEAPYFFDPTLAVPPHAVGVNSTSRDYEDYLTDVPMSPPMDDCLPSYFSVGEVHQFIRRKTREKVKYSGRYVKPHQMTELDEALSVQPYLDEEW
jgi:hypothetical protein